MITMLGGIIAMIIGFLLMALWWGPFTVILQAAVPLVLLVGGGVMSYLGTDEWKEEKAAAANAELETQEESA